MQSNAITRLLTALRLFHAGELMTKYTRMRNQRERSVSKTRAIAIRLFEIRSIRFVVRDRA